MSSASLEQATIVQFGTGRFLLGHVDALVSESLAAGHSQEAILVVQTSARAEGKTKARALAKYRHYPVEIRGRTQGRDIDTRQTVTSVADCWIADEAWGSLERHFVDVARYVVSNTGDQGYYVDGDSSLAEVPSSFPGKLTKLLHARFVAGREGLTILPCELISRNGERLRELVIELARQDYADASFLDWLETRCIWANTLVDRIVSAALEPLGAVAEPYALWAIERQPGLDLPCRHEAVCLVDTLAPYELRKLHILNLAHSYLVHCWRRDGFGSSLGHVREAMATPALYDALRQVLDEEVLPTLSTVMDIATLEAYRETTLERFSNPTLDHHLQDIAQNHAMKCQRRLQPVIDMARERNIATPRLDEAMHASRNHNH